MLPSLFDFLAALEIRDQWPSVQTATIQPIAVYPAAFA